MKDTFKFKLHVFLVVNLNSLRGRNKIGKKISMEIFPKNTENVDFYTIGNHNGFYVVFNLCRYIIINSKTTPICFSN